MEEIILKMSESHSNSELRHESDSIAPYFIKRLLIRYEVMTVRTTFPRKILNNGKEPCEPLMTLI